MYHSTLATRHSPHLMHGGDIIARVLRAQDVPFLFTLCGGHISPLLVGCKNLGIRVIDTRHEATAVFAADAVARLTGAPGVAAVTAGPGVTNTITAVQNARMAQSPVVLIGGAAPTVLQGRGALQDIDQLALLKPLVKWARSVRRVCDLGPTLEAAFHRAQEGVPGPVFVECPVDTLYDEALVRDWYGSGAPGRTAGARLLNAYLRWRVDRLFAGASDVTVGPRVVVAPPIPQAGKLRKVDALLRKAERPLLLVGSQAMLHAPTVDEVAAAVERLGVPVYLSGMARGLLGTNHALQMRHRRRQALQEADCVLLAGVPCDFRLDYGRHIRRNAVYVSVNRSRADLTRNRRPDVGLLGDPAYFLCQLAALVPSEDRWLNWRGTLRSRDDAREREIVEQARPTPGARLNPLHLCRELEHALGPRTILVADGGDFVATASYILRPPGPLTWLDPGAFGTLGVGAGFALGARLCRPDDEVWILYGDGSVGYSLVEFDTFSRHRLPVIAVVGNDAGWTQIALEQVDMLGDDVGTVLAPTAYHKAAEGLGGTGFLLDDADAIPTVLLRARRAAADGRPVLINARIGTTDFRKGSISM